MKTKLTKKNLKEYLKDLARERREVAEYRAAKSDYCNALELEAQCHFAYEMIDSIEYVFKDA